MYITVHFIFFVRMLKISISISILVFKFYEYIKYIDGYFYINIFILKINKNILKLIKIFYKSVKITLINEIYILILY